MLCSFYLAYMSTHILMCLTVAVALQIYAVQLISVRISLFRTETTDPVEDVRYTHMLSWYLHRWDLEIPSIASREIL